MFDHKHVYVSLLKHKCLKVKHVSVSCFYSVALKGSIFQKRESHKITYRSGHHEKELDLVLIWKQQEMEDQVL